MSSRSHLTKDLNESIKSLLGKNVKILFKHVVRLEIKNDKTEKKVLIETHFNYLEIQAIESKRGNQLLLTVNDKIYSFLSGEDSTCSIEVDNMISVLAAALRNIFPRVSFEYIIRKIDIPNARLKQVRDEDVLSSPVAKNIGPCGGFSTQYACMCDYHSMPYREEVAWDVDTIYLSHDTRELCLKDFDHLDPKDLIPIISALEYNTWFKKLRASHIKLSHESLDRIIHVLKRSGTLEELYFDNLGIKSDFVVKLALALNANSNIPVNTIDLSFNMIDDKGVIHLSGPIGKVPKDLVHLNLAQCGLTSKGVNYLASAFNSNNSMSTTLTYLNLSGNNLKDEINNMYKFFAQPNALSHLDLSSTDTVVDNLFGAVLRGCATNLVYLNVSKNQFSAKKSKDIPPSFKQFFSSAISLKYFNVSHCKLPPEALKHLLLGLACNDSISDVHLDLSSNQLGSNGAHVLESCIHGVHSVAHLDVSDNNIDGEFAVLIGEISKNKSIKHLNMGRNLCNMKSKHVTIVVDSLVQMIQDEDCVLQSLIISDCKLKSDLFNMINALGSNTCLQMIDISGNMIADSGARLLAKALQINNKLQTIIYDKNNITLQGYSDICYALEMNYSLKYMPFPVFDVNNSLKISAEKTDIVMRKIQDLLHRNVSPKNFSSHGHGQAFRLQQGFLLSSTQQSIDRLVAQTQEAIKSLAAESCDSNSEINQATNLIQDADNSKQLLLRLQEVIHRKDEIHPIESKLIRTSDEVYQFFIEYLKTCSNNMIEYCREQCPNILFDNIIMNDIREGCEAKAVFPKQFLQNCLLRHAGNEIRNKIDEINLAIASHLSDRISYEVIESLNRSYKTLIDQLSHSRSGSLSNDFRSRSHFNSSRYSRSSKLSDFWHGLSDQSQERSPIATPQMHAKRKSVTGRKLRPKSVVDTIEGYSMNDMCSLLPKMSLDLPNVPKEIQDSNNSNVTNKPLQHLVKGRPRRTKTHAPSRSILRTNEINDPLSITEVDEGLDSFFKTRSHTPILSPTSDECSSLSFQTDNSYNHEHSGKITPVSFEDSPLDSDNNKLKPRSISNDNLENQSLFDDVRRNRSTLPKDRRDNLITSQGHIETTSSNDMEDGENLQIQSPTVSVKLRSAQFSNHNHSNYDVPKSPIPLLKSKTTLKVIQRNFQSKQPRPWSVSDIGSTATAKIASYSSDLNKDNKVESSHTASHLDPDHDADSKESTAIIERRSVKEMASGFDSKKTNSVKKNVEDVQSVNVLASKLAPFRKSSKFEVVDITIDDNSNRNFDNKLNNNNNTIIPTKPTVVFMKNSQMAKTVLRDSNFNVNDSIDV